MEPRRNLLPRLLAGLQVGILGGLGTLAWLIILSYWNLRGPWALVNLFSYATRGGHVWDFPFSMATLIGISAHLFSCGVLGMFIGWVLPRPQGPPRPSMTGLIFGVVISLMTYEFFWRRQVPALGQYIAPASLLIAHLIFGMSLAQFPRFYLRLERADSHPQEPQPQEPQPPQPLPEPPLEPPLEPLLSEEPRSGAPPEASGLEDPPPEERMPEPGEGL
jgi:hypothetical protein